MDTNPSLIQPGPPGQSSRTPLVLIHDGSGLVSSYYWLGSLGRKVYGIHNPHFDSASGNWEGGLHEMAKAYLPLLKSVVHHGKVLLGGWSLGGLVTLEMAHLLRDDPDITVTGLLLVDTVYPKTTAPAESTAKVLDHFVPPPDINASLHLKLQEVFRNSRRMIDEWQPPSWKAAPGEALSGRNASLLPPPAILLRATGYVLTQGPPRGEEELASIDTARQAKKLGWDEYEHKFIRVALDVDGHHFNIFTEDKVKKLTTKVNMACSMLDVRC